MIIPTSHRCLTAQVLRDTRTGRWARRSDYLAQCLEISRAQAEERRRLALTAPLRATRHAIHSTGSAPWSKPARLHTPAVAAHVHHGNLFTMPISELAARHRERFHRGT